jgi:hypothetical protein
MPCIIYYYFDHSSPRAFNETRLGLNPNDHLRNLKWPQLRQRLYAGRLTLTWLAAL